MIYYDKMDVTYMQGSDYETVKLPAGPYFDYVLNKVIDTGSLP